MAEMVVTLTGDEAKLYRSLQRIVDQQAAMEKGFTDVEKAAKKAAREAEQDAAKQKAAQDKLNKSYQDQIAIMNEQAVAITKGKAAAAEMKAIREGLTKEQAANLRMQLEELELIEQAAAKKKQDAADRKKAEDQANADKKKADDQARADKKRAEEEAEKAAKKRQEQIDKIARDEDRAAKKRIADAKKAYDAELEAAIKAGEARAAAAKKAQEEESKLAEKKIADIKKERDDRNRATLDAVGGLATMAASYVSVSVAVQAVTQNLREQLGIQKESLNVSEQIGKAQSNATKNFTGLSTKQKAAALQEAKAIQQEIGFPEQAPIVEALGAGYSSAGDIVKTNAAVRAAAKLNRLTPENIRVDAAGALDIARASGNADAESNLAFLLNVGAVSRTENPQDLSRAVAPVIASGTSTVPSQDKMQASRETAAVYATLNQLTADAVGRESATATQTLLGKIDQFFKDLQSTRDEVATKITELETKGRQTPLAKAKSESKLQLAELEVQEKQRFVNRLGNRNDPAALKAKAELADAIASRDLAKEEMKLSEEDQRKLNKLKAERDALANVTDSGTIAGRLSTFQSNPLIRDKLLETPFGEIKYQSGYRKLLTAGTDDAKSFAANANQISFEKDSFRKEIAQQETISPELRQGTSLASTRAVIEEMKNDPRRAKLGEINELIAETLRLNRPDGPVAGGVASKLEETAALGRATQSDPRQLALIGLTQLSDRATTVTNTDSTEAAKIKLAQIQKARDRLTAIATEYEFSPSAEFVERRNAASDQARGGVSNEVMQRQNALIEDQTKILQGIMLNTGKHKLSDYTSPPPFAIRAQAAQTVAGGAP